MNIFFRKEFQIFFSFHLFASQATIEHLSLRREKQLE